METQKAHEWQMHDSDTITSSDSEGDTSDNDTSGEDCSSNEHSKATPTQLSSVAGVPHSRRKAKQRNLKPLKALVGLVKEAHKPN